MVRRTSSRSSTSASPRRPRPRPLACGLGLGRLGDAEVEDLDDVRRTITGDQEDVLGLEVAVDDALRVRGRERAADLARDPERARDVHRALALDAVSYTHL